LVVVLLVVVTATVVLPGMRNLADSNRLRTEVRRLHAAIYLVRSEAILRNMPVLMCPSPMASTGERVCSGIFSEGWIIFPDRDRDRHPDESEELIRVSGALPEGFTLTNRKGTRHAEEFITYLPDGTSHRNRTLMLCSANPDMPSWSVVMNIVGRPRVARDWGDCRDRQLEE
jgi:type IV fimbrial biogenesis protein FimT